MATTPEQWAAQDEAFSKQYDAEQAQKAQQEAAAKADQPPSVLSQFTARYGTVTHLMLDDKIAAAQSMFRLGRDAAAGITTGATNTVDAVVKGAAESGRGLAMAEDPEHAQAALEANLTSPVWDHAKAALLDFRDAVAVKDPTLADNLVQGVAQLAIPFAGYSRALSGLHGLAKMVAAGAITDATALQPHDMRMADMIALGRTTEGKLGDVLRTLAPDGSALNAYIHYLADRKNESAAEGTFKNVLDGLGVNLVVTPLIAAAATTLKHGTAGLRYMIDNGVGSTSGMVPSPAMQRGAVGDMSANGRPLLRQGEDLAESLYQEQARRDMVTANNRMTRYMQALHEQQHTKGAGVQYSTAGDAHTVTSDNGATTALQRGKDLRVIDTQTFKGRGQGEGTARMERLLAEAQLKKLNLISDSQVSAPAQRVYERLRSMGYDVKENPSRLDAGTGEKFSASELKGVYEVRPKIVKE